MEPAQSAARSGSDRSSWLEELGYLFLNTVQAIFLGSWSVLWISAALVASLLSREWPLALARRAWGPGLIWASRADVHVHESSAELDPTQTYVFVMNHQSMFDIPVAFTHLPVNLRFFAKRILAFVPFIGWYMSRTKMIFVDRSNKKRAQRSVETAVSRVTDGHSLLTYPEGTRSLDGRIKRFKRGPFVIAHRAGAPVVPVVIVGSAALLPKGGFRLRPCRVELHIGAPIPTADLEEAEVEALVERIRASMIETHRALGGAGGVSQPPPSLTG